MLSFEDSDLKWDFSGKDELRISEDDLILDFSVIDKLSDFDLSCKISDSDKLSFEDCDLK